MASLKHLYTRTDDGGPTDELERWFDREFESPAVPVINKVVSNEPLTPDDWQTLIRFLAAQDLRTPRSYFEDMERWDRTLPSLLKQGLDASIERFSEAVRTGQALPSGPSKQAAGIPLLVKLDREAGEVRVEVLVGRELWTSQMKRMLETTAKVLHQHRWTILAPPKGTTWLTSDNPVIHLAYKSASDYTLERAWAKPKMNIMLPLGPQHLLITQVGERSPLRGTRMTEEQARLVRRVTAENAFRSIFAEQPDSEVLGFCGRKEDAKAYEAERAFWATWQEKQSEAETSFCEP